MFTNEKMAENTAHRLAMFLKGKGIEITHYDSTLRPIEKVLRGSWYVKKAKEMGHTDCIHIGLICGGFFAILENGQIMTGKNIMICDGISSVVMELSEIDPIDAFQIFQWKGFNDGDDDDDYVVVTEFSQLKKLIETLESLRED